MGRGKWLVTGSVAVVALGAGMFLGFRGRMMDTNRARIVPTCMKVYPYVICEVQYMVKDTPRPRVSFEKLDSERLLVVATRVERGRDDILPSQFIIERHRLESAGMNYDKMKIYYHAGATQELKEVKTFPVDRFRYPRY